MREVTTYGTITQGELKIHRRKDFLRNLSLLGDCRISLTVKKTYRKRSNPQNAFYHGVVVQILQECLQDATGEPYTAAQAHETLKKECNFKEIVNKTTGEVGHVTSSTKTLTTTEFEEYLERCRQWIYDWFQVDVPMPNEQTKLDI